jgi:hypothetical protein
MQKEHTANVELSSSDPQFIQKYMTLKGLDDMSMRIRDNRNQMLNLVLYVVAIILSVPLALFAENGNWLAEIAIISILVIFLAYNIYNMKKEEDMYAKVSRQLREKAVELGLRHPALNNHDEHGKPDTEQENGPHQHMR